MDVLFILVVSISIIGSVGFKKVFTGHIMLNQRHDFESTLTECLFNAMCQMDKLFPPQ